MTPAVLSAQPESRWRHRVGTGVGALITADPASRCGLRKEDAGLGVLGRQWFHRPEGNACWRWGGRAGD